MELTKVLHSLWNLALAYLLLGDYVKGWEYYEVRFENEDFEHVSVPTSGPRRHLARLHPRSASISCVVRAGLGDVIQFCRYLNLLDAAGIPFVFLTRPSLIKLMRLWMGLGDKSSTRQHKSQLRFKAPRALMSLPRILVRNCILFHRFVLIKNLDSPPRSCV